MNDDSLIFQKKLLIILHKASSEIRSLIKLREYQRAYDLADTIEFIPELMLYWRTENRQMIEAAFHQYQRCYSEGGFDYSSLMQMDDEEFTKCYLDIEPTGTAPLFV